MPPTLQQVREKWGPPPGNGKAADALHVSAIPAALVTNMPEWDSYLRHCQAKLDQAMAEAQAQKELMVRTFNREKQLEAQCGYYISVSRANAIRELMDLPAQLKEQTTEAPKA